MFSSLPTINYKVAMTFKYYQAALKHFTRVFLRLGRFDTQDFHLVAVIFGPPISVTGGLAIYAIKSNNM